MDFWCCEYESVFFSESPYNMSLITLSSPKLWGDFLILEKLLRGSEFFYFKEGESIWETCQSMMWRGDSTWKKWIVCLFFLFLNLARLFVIWYWLSFQMSLLLYRSIAFLKFGYGPKANILIVLLITTNVMQVVSFVLLDLLSYSLLIVTRNK